MEVRLPEIRVVLIGLPVLLADIVRGLLADRSDVVVAAEWRDDPPVLEDVVAARPDVVVGAAGGAWERDVAALLEQRPLLRVLALADEARSMLLCELRPHVALLGELSATTLLNAIGTRPEWPISIPLAG